MQGNDAEQSQENLALMKGSILLVFKITHFKSRYATILKKMEKRADLE